VVGGRSYVPDARQVAASCWNAVARLEGEQVTGKWRLTRTGATVTTLFSKMRFMSR
jgi:hypothetical protein